MKFYTVFGSLPCRACLLLFQTLNLNPEMVIIDVFKGEHMNPEFIKINPQHSIPVLEDNGFILTESRAIMGYLVDKYSPDKSYYPNDPKERAKVHQRLYFEMSVLYQSLFDAYMEPIHRGETEIDVEPEKRMIAALEVLEIFMADSKYVAGENLTIADFATIATVSSIDACGFDLSPYPKIKEWFERCKKEMKNYEDANGKGAVFMGELNSSEHHPTCVSSIRFIVIMGCTHWDIHSTVTTQPATALFYRGSTKMNPQHTIPVLEDNGFVLSESRAILGYLVDKYSVDKSYYPNDPKGRGVVNQRLLFDLSVLYQSFYDAYLEPVLTGETTIAEERLPKLTTALGFLDAFLQNSKYVAGDKLTIADYSIVSSISTIDAAGHDLSPYPKVREWFERCKKEMKNYDEVNAKAAASVGEFIKTVLNIV